MGERESTLGYGPPALGGDPRLASAAGGLSCGRDTRDVELVSLDAGTERSVEAMLRRPRPLANGLESGGVCDVPIGRRPLWGSKGDTGSVRANEAAADAGGEGLGSWNQVGLTVGGRRDERGGDGARFRGRRFRWGCRVAPVRRYSFASARLAGNWSRGPRSRAIHRSGRQRSYCRRRRRLSPRSV